MLHIDPHRRLNATQVLNHSWIAQRESLPHLRLTLQDAQLVKVGSFFCYRDFVVCSLGDKIMQSYASHIQQSSLESY